jgi:hypothetical protein
LCVNKSQFVPVIFEPPCMYDKALRRVHEIIVAVKKQQVLHISVCVRVCVCVGGGGVGARARACACSLIRYAMHPLWLHRIFQHYLTTRFSGKSHET